MPARPESAYIRTYGAIAALLEMIGHTCIDVHRGRRGRYQEMGSHAAIKAYEAIAEEYRKAVGRIDHATQIDRDNISQWARQVRGQILDVGSGPGQWTDFLRRQGCAISGVEPSRQFLRLARESYPESEFRLGKAESLQVPDSSLGGILAWYCLIHHEPPQIDAALAEFFRALRSGGRVLIGFFSGDHVEPFDHAVATAFRWPIQRLSERIEAAGFTVSAAWEVKDTRKVPRHDLRSAATIVATV